MQQGNLFPLTSHSFYDDRVLVQQCRPESLKFMPNMRSMVFRVMPKLVYDATRTYFKEKKAYDAMGAEQPMETKLNATALGNETHAAEG